MDFFDKLSSNKQQEMTDSKQELLDCFKDLKLNMLESKYIQKTLDGKSPQYQGNMINYEGKARKELLDLAINVAKKMQTDRRGLISFGNTASYNALQEYLNNVSQGQNNASVSQKGRGALGRTEKTYLIQNEGDQNKYIAEKSALEFNNLEAQIQTTRNLASFAGQNIDISRKNKQLLSEKAQDVAEKYSTAAISYKNLGMYEEEKSCKDNADKYINLAGTYKPPQKPQSNLSQAYHQEPKPQSIQQSNNQHIQNKQILDMAPQQIEKAFDPKKQEPSTKDQINDLLLLANNKTSLLEDREKAINKALDLFQPLRDLSTTDLRNQLAAANMAIKHEKNALAFPEEKAKLDQLIAILPSKATVDNGSNFMQACNSVIVFAKEAKNDEIKFIAISNLLAAIQLRDQKNGDLTEGSRQLLNTSIEEITNSIQNHEIKNKLPKQDNNQVQETSFARGELDKNFSFINNEPNQSIFDNK